MTDPNTPRVYRRADGSIKVCLGLSHGYSTFVFDASGDIIEETLETSDWLATQQARAEARRVRQFSRPEDDNNFGPSRDSQ